MHHPDPYLHGHGDTRYRVSHYELDLTYKVATNRLDERAQLHVEIVEATPRIDVDLRGLHVGKVLLDGRPTRYRRKAHCVTVEVGRREPGERFVLELRVSGKPGPVPGVHGEAGWEELSDGSMVGSQPQGAPSWFPCNDDAANKATYRITVTTDAEYHVIANGTRTECTRVGGNNRWTYEMRRPMSPYLATVQVGDYVEDERSAGVPVSVVHPRGLDVGEGTSFEHQGAMVDFFSECFGPYPFAEYRAVVVEDDLEIPLEAQGLSTFGSNFAPLEWENERLVAHELSHQWFGNLVTGQHLADIWLHEGFACYSEWLWSDHRRRWCESETVQEQAARHHAGLPKDLGDVTLADPGMEAMFDDWVYKRGALTLHAVRAITGDEVFFGILREWTRLQADRAVTTEQFIEHCRTVSGELGDRVVETLHAWLHEPELPDLPVLG